MAYSSATRIGGLRNTAVSPIWMIAVRVPRVARASTEPIMLGFTMKP